MHVAEANVFVAVVDLQRRRLLLRRTDHDAVADGDNSLLFGVAAFGAFALGQTRSRVDVLSLMAKAAGALPDPKAAGFAEIILPRIVAADTGPFVWRWPLALPERLRAGE